MTTGTHEEDGPGTWDPPRFSSGESRLMGSRGRNVSGVAPVSGGTGAAVKNKTSRTGVGRWRGTTGAAAEGDEGVGGLHKSVDVGERGGVRTRPSKGGPCWCEPELGKHGRTH